MGLTGGKLYSVLLSGPQAYLGQVATRCGNFSLAFNTTNKQSMSRTWHYARDDISSLQVAIANWTVQSGVEAGTGAALTVTASIEYPAGTFTQIQFSGSASGSVSDGATLLSDATVVSIPNGAIFWVRIWRSSTAGIMFGISDDPVHGDAFAFGVTTVDKTMAGTVSDADGFHICVPAAIVARTKKPAIYLMGDSRVYAANGASGYGDTYSDASGDLGELARSIGPSFAYINGGSPSDAASIFKTNGTRRIALAAAYCSHILDEYGVNDLYSVGSTSSALISNLATIYQNFPTQKIFRTTIPPETTSTDNWVTTANQTAKSGNTERITFNNAVRSGGTGLRLSGYFEVADQVESSRDSGKWVVNGTSKYATNDGVHESNAGYLLVKNSGCIQPSVFRR